MADPGTNTIPRVPPGRPAQGAWGPGEVSGICKMGLMVPSDGPGWVSQLIISLDAHRIDSGTGLPLMGGAGKPSQKPMLGLVRQCYMHASAHIVRLLLI